MKQLQKIDIKIYQIKKKNLNQLRRVTDLEFHEMESIQLDQGDKHMNINELNTEQALVSINQQIKLVENNSKFLIRIYSTLTNLLFRMVNSIKKTCPSELFDQKYDSKLYFLTTIHDQLENQFKIKILVKDPVICYSNQLLNAIYDHLKDYPIKERLKFQLIKSKILSKNELTQVQDKIIQYSIQLASILVLIYKILFHNLVISIQINSYTSYKLMDMKQHKKPIEDNQSYYLIQQKKQSFLLQEYLRIVNFCQNSITRRNFKIQWKDQRNEKRISLNVQQIDEESSLNTEIKTKQNSPTQSSTSQLERSSNSIKQIIFLMDSLIINCSQSQVNLIQSDHTLINLHHMNRKIKNLNKSSSYQKSNLPQQFDVHYQQEECRTLS